MMSLKVVESEMEDQFPVILEIGEQASPGEGCWLGWAILGGLLLRSSASWSWLQDEHLESLDSSN